MFKLTLIVAITAALAQNAPPNDRVRMIAVAQIKLIDAKKNTIIIGLLSGPPRGGPGAGAGSRGPGFPGGGPPRGGQQNDTKVIVSTDTLIHEDNNEIGFTDLRVGDSVKVTGRPRNKDIEATEILLLRRAGRSSDDEMAGANMGAP